MDSRTSPIKSAILDFLRRHDAELPVESVAFGTFIDQVLHYLSISDTIRSIEEQKTLIVRQLLPAEKEGHGVFKFVLEHNLDPDRGLINPAIQISGTSGNFHALVIKRQDKSLQGYEGQQSLSIFGQLYQIGLVTNRIRSSVNLAEESPLLHTLKEGCRTEARPVIYFLGAARQFPNAESSRASVAHQTKSIQTIFASLEQRFGNNAVIGTGGWAGSGEGSLGVPRIGYLHARQTNRIILTTMPRVGAYDRHENPTLEVFCGEEWGDDSAILAAACDGAFIFRPHGTWTQIEIENLLAQKKPFVVIDDPEKNILVGGERKREITTERGSYFVYADAREAAGDLLQKLGEAGFGQALTKFPAGKQPRQFSPAG